MSPSAPIPEHLGLSPQRLDQLAFLPLQGGSFLLFPDLSCWWSPELRNFLALPEESCSFSDYFSLLFPNDAVAFRKALRQLWSTGSGYAEHRIWQKEQIIPVIFSARQYTHPEKGSYAVGSVMVPGNRDGAGCVQIRLDFHTERFLEPSPELAQLFRCPPEQIQDRPLSSFILPEQQLLFSHWYAGIPASLSFASGEFLLRDRSLLVLNASYQPESDQVLLFLWRKEPAAGAPSVWEHLRKQERMYTRLLSSFSHDLREPMQRLLSGLELSLMQIPGIFPPETRQQLEQYGAAARQDLLSITQLLDSLSQISQVNESGGSICFQQITLSELLLPLLNMVRSCTAGLDAQVLVEEPEIPELTLFCDREYTQRILLNLVFSTVKSLDRERVLYLGLEVRDKEVLFSVSCSGFKERMALDHLFFNSLHGTFPPPEETWDFELWVARVLAALQKGRILEEKRPDGSSIRTLCLPRDLQSGSRPVMRQQLPGSPCPESLCDAVEKAFAAMEQATRQ